VHSVARSNRYFAHHGFAVALASSLASALGNSTTRNLIGVESQTRNYSQAPHAVATGASGQAG
jgi:hypothetical protein